MNYLNIITWVAIIISLGLNIYTWRVNKKTRRLIDQTNSQLYQNHQMQRRK